MQGLDDEEGLAYLIYRFNVYKRQLEEHELLDHLTATALRNLTGENRDGASVNMFHARGAINAVVSVHFGVSVVVFPTGEKRQVMTLAENPNFESSAMVILPTETPGGVGHLGLDTTYLTNAQVKAHLLEQGGGAV
jgi:hypothetical protein